MNKMIRRYFISLLLSVWACMLISAQEFVSGDLRYRVIADGEVAVVPWVDEGQSRYADVMIVPETVYYDGMTCKVTAIADSAFYNSGITELQLPNSITRIGRWAMADAFDLVSVTLPLHLRQVSEGMLAGTDITSIIIPEGVTRIEDSAFEDCNLLHSVFLPSSLLQIGDYAFDGCHNLFELFSPAAQPPAWMGDDAMPAIEGVDLVLADDHAVATWRDDEVWGNPQRFSMWVDEDVAPTFEITDGCWRDHWSRVDLGHNMAYRVYGEDGFMMALTTADHFYLPVSEHQAEFVIVPTNGISDADDVVPITVAAPAVGHDQMVADRVHPDIYVIDGVLHIDGDNHGTWTTIYDIYGRLYYERPSNDGQVITLDRNRVYIVIVGNYVTKVFL